MPYDNASDDELEDDEGMDDPVILRGLLQCLSIGAFFTLRYVLDVLLTVAVVQALSHRLIFLVHCSWNAACCFPVASFALLYLCGSLDSGLLGFIARLMLRGCILRAVFTALLDDSMVVWSLRKRHIWVPLGWWVTFTRVSSGRMLPHGIWMGFFHYYLCRAMPWIVRLALFWATWSTPCAQHYDGRHLLPSYEALHPHHYSNHLKAAVHRHAPDPQQTCASFTGFPVPCDELERVRDFNGKVMPTMQDAHYRVIRKAMSEQGFAAHVWHVGHAIPDPSKSSTRNEEDFGWNLFAQHAVDNLKLGHCLVTCAEAHHVGAHHVRCSTSKNCEQSPSSSSRWW